MQNTIYERHKAHVALRQKKLKESLYTLLNNKENVVLEIGSGHGEFLCAYAKKFPHQFCLGLDILGPRIQKAHKKAHKEGLTNIAFVKAQAQETVEVLPEDSRLEAVYILFPDPWPKRKHFANRLIQASFLDILIQKMAPSAKIFFRTDHLDYFEWATKIFLAHPSFSLCMQEEWPIYVKTRFEEITGGQYQSLVATFQR